MNGPSKTTHLTNTSDTNQMIPSSSFFFENLARNGVRLCVKSMNTVDCTKGLVQLECTETTRLKGMTSTQRLPILFNPFAWLFDIIVVKICGSKSTILIQESLPVGPRSPLLAWTDPTT